MSTIPVHWSSQSLASLVDYRAGRTPSRAEPEYWERGRGGTPWVSIADMLPFGSVRTTKEQISQSALDAVFGGRVVSAGTLLMSFKLTIGRVGTLAVDACHNEAIIAIYPRADVEQRYLGYYLSQVDFGALQDRQIKGYTLNRDKLDRIEILVPPIQEQRAIATALDLARRGAELQAQALLEAEGLRRAAMHALFTRGLRGEAQHGSDIGPVPESWEVVPLGSLGRIGNGSTPRKTFQAYWEDGRFPWLTSSKVYDREIIAADQFVTETALRECHLPIVEPGAVLIAITGQGKTLGHSAVLRMRATVNQHLAYLATDLDRADPSFVRGYLETQYDRFRQVGSGGGSTKGALTCAYLRSVPVPLPKSLDEQREIAAVLDTLDRKIDLHRRKRAVLDDLFKALLHMLMTAEIRVADLNLDALTARPSGSGASA